MSGIKFLCGNAVTAIENDFIDNYMADVPSSVFSLIYIYAYRCAASGISVSNSDIAKKFGIIESDVIKAWKYWKSVGLITTAGSREEPVIEFLSCESIKNNNEKKDDKEKDNVKIVVERPVFKPSDINEIINGDPEAGGLLKLAESTKGKTLSTRETELIIWMYQTLELPFEVILVLLSFCYKSGKSVRYMEKTAVDWVEKGILTSEAASDYLSYYNNYGQILKFFGVSERSATAPERNYMDKWIKEWSLSMELIETAAKRTVENTGKAAFSYCNKILETWHNAGYKTMKEVENAEAAFLNKKSSKQTVPMQQPKGVFNNYNQKVYSADEIAEILKRKGNMQ